MRRGSESRRVSGGRGTDGDLAGWLDGTLRVAGARNTHGDGLTGAERGAGACRGRSGDLRARVGPRGD